MKERQRWARHGSAHQERRGGSVTHEKAITDALNAVEGVHKVKIAKGAIYVTYDPLKITEKKPPISTLSE